MTPLESMARAMCRGHWQHFMKSTEGIEKTVDSYWRDYLFSARAALEAIRKPSQAMRECGHMAGWHGGIEGFDEGEEDAAESLWERMIDAALRERSKDA